MPSLPAPVMTLPSIDACEPEGTASVSATAVGASSMMLITRVPGGAASPSESVTPTAKLTLVPSPEVLVFSV
ncbi:MAG: hypothetical protein E5W04_12990 [Mesorhizobium sp.]|nr:MAG: hypothetical protein E5W04_12990 [Mesorhizobium sp.]